MKNKIKIHLRSAQNCADLFLPFFKNSQHFYEINFFWGTFVGHDGL